MIGLRIGFSTSTGWISKIIRWFTKSKFSHAFVLIDNEPMLGPCVFQSDSGGIQIITQKAFDFEHNPLQKVYQPTMDLFPAIRECADLLREEYDYAGLLGMVWVEFWWHVFKARVKNPLHNANEFFCSAFVVKVIQVAKWPGAETLDPGSTDAQMLADFLDTHTA